jgi:protein involved in polysaccharide export with SLBB domain
MRSLLLLLIGAAPLAAPLSAQSTASTPTPAAAQGVLRPGDLVRLKIWREPDLSGEFQVNESGEIVFPKIGPLQVTESSPETLKRTLLDAYSVYLRNPSIEITMLRRVQVLGAVRNPGLYPVDPTMTLADVLALAGGATAQGNTKKFELRRDNQRITTTITAATRVADTPLRSGDQLFIPERGWLSRNTWVVAAGLSATTSILIAVLR